MTRARRVTIVYHSFIALKSDVTVHRNDYPYHVYVNGLREVAFINHASIVH